MSKSKRFRYYPYAPFATSSHIPLTPMMAMSRIDILEKENKAKDELIKRFQSEIRDLERSQDTDPRMSPIQHPIPQSTSGIFLVPYSDLVARNKFLEDESKEKDKLVK